MKKGNFVSLSKNGEIFIVNKGFCWGAFFSGFIFALVKKQWVLALKLFPAFLFNGYLLMLNGRTQTGSNAALVISLIILIICCVYGFLGNKWLINSLKKQGYL